MRRSRAGHVCVLFFVVLFFFPPFYKPIHSIEKEKKTTTTTTQEKTKKNQKIQSERGYAWLVCSRHSLTYKSVRGLLESTKNRRKRGLLRKSGSLIPFFSFFLYFFYFFTIIAVIMIIIITMTIL